MQAPPRRRRRGLAALVVLVSLLLACALGAYLLIGRTLDAPPWLRERIETRIAQTLPGMTVAFGRMSLRVEENGLARVILWDVDLRNTRGETIAALADIEAGFAPLPLLRGEMVLRHAQISGAFITLRRDEQGGFGLALGDAFSAQTRTPDLTQIIAGMDQIVTDPRFAALDAVEADAVTLRYEDARARRGWTADGGRLRLSRNAGALRLGGDLALLSGSGVATLEVNAESPIGETQASFGIRLSGLSSGDIATQSPALAWLGALDAPISGSLRSAISSEGYLGRLNATLQIGKGALRPTEGARPVPFDSARAYFSFDPLEGLLRFDEISVKSELVDAGAEGVMRLASASGGWPDAIEGQVRLNRIKVPAGDLVDHELALSGAEADFRLGLAPFSVDLARFRVTDPAYPLSGKGFVSATRDGWEVSLDGLVDRTSPEQVLSLWPETVQPKARDWVAKHVHSGMLRDAVFAVRLGPERAPYSYLTFGFENAHVSYNENLPPVHGASGFLTIDGAHLGLRVNRGRIEPGQGGVLEVGGSEFTIQDLKAKPATGQLDLVARGSLQAALSYADNDKWRLLRKVGRDPGLATGRAELAGRVTLPLERGLKLPDIDIALSGTARTVASDKIIPNRAMEAEELLVRLDNSMLEVSGPLTVSGVAAQGRWLQPLQGGSGQVTAEVALDDKSLRAFGVTLPQGMLGGRGKGALVIDLPKGQTPSFSLESALAGLSLAVPQIGWRLPANGTGRFRVSGRLGKPVKIDSLSLRAAGLDAEGTIALNGSGAFSALDLSRLKVGDWMDVKARIQSNGAGAAPRVEINAGALDFRRAPTGDSGTGGGGSGAGGGTLALALDRLVVTDSITLTGFKGDFATGLGLDGRFSARINGKAPITGRIVPQGNRLGFRITGEDAGEVLKAAGLLKTVQNGTISLDLAPVKGKPGTFDGRMTIAGARLRKAPAIGALLDAISIVGLLDQLNGPGIFFSEVEARFRLSPNRVVLTQSSAVGPSMGISMDGFYDLRTGTMDMQGVLSPIYFLNGIGRLIARKGEGLIGFNFNLRGSVADPKVAVNPLSVFTPGMFRDIFRRPPPKVAE